MRRCSNKEPAVFFLLISSLPEIWTTGRRYSWYSRFSSVVLVSGKNTTSSEWQPREFSVSSCVESQDVIRFILVGNFTGYFNLRKFAYQVVYFLSLWAVLKFWTLKIASIYFFHFKVWLFKFCFNFPLRSVTFFHRKWEIWYR